MLTLGGDATGFGVLQATTAKRRPWSERSPPSPWYPGPDLNPENFALGWPSFKTKPGQLQMLDADVRMGEKIRFVIGGAQELLGHGAGGHQLPDAKRGSAAHGQQLDPVDRSAQPGFCYWSK